ncbi:hypothetical protein AtubIFM57258_003268 [Aspergillus tubingensis]|nr:hypothetical protein AtubIFM57258_003268 [Aspergillus tubingensis]
MQGFSIYQAYASTHITTSLAQLSTSSLRLEVAVVCGQVSHRNDIDSNEIRKHVAEPISRLGTRQGTSRGNYNKQYTISSLGVPDPLIPRQPIRASVKNLSVAVGSSTTKENLPDDSFAGDQNFTSALWAINFQQANGFDHLRIALSVGVQRMICSNASGSGMMISIGSEIGFDKVVNAA